MKYPVLFVLALLSLSLGCKREDPNAGDEPQEETYEERLAGNWNLTSVDYEASFFNPLTLQNQQIEGSGTQVQGSFNFSLDPQEFDYDYSFTASVKLADSIQAVPFPVEQDGQGTWSANEAGTEVTTTEDGNTVTYTVLENEANRQRFRGSFEENMQGFPVTVKVELLLERP